MTDKTRKTPENAAVRLSMYLRHLREMRDDEKVVSDQLARLTGTSGARVRKDLSYFGQFGTPGRGYTVSSLREQLSRALGLDHSWNVALVGAGKLGRALLGYLAFQRSGFHIMAAFDTDSAKIGTDIGGCRVYHPYEIPKVVRRSNLQVAIITAPGDVAQESVDLLVISGIRGIVNFSPMRVIVPETIKLRNVDFTSQLEVLPFYISDPHPLFSSS